LGATKKAYIDFGSGKQRWGLQTDPILQPDTWHHIVGVFDRSQKRARLYVDGRERATGALTTRSSSGIGESTTIGRWFSGGPGPSFEGVIDEVMIFNRPLSTEEIRQLYAAVGGFGPVAEVELGDIDESPQAALVDFDTGTLVKIPDHLRAAGEAEVFPWVTERGLDVGAEFAGDEYGLFGIDVVATKIAPDQWDKITPAELHKALAAEPIGVDRDEREIMMSAKGEHPPTFAFRTREGGTGVLQVVDADRSKKTIRLRYKMLQGEPGPQRGYDVSAVLGKWRIRPTETSGDVQWIQFFDNGIMIRHEGKGDFMHRYELRDDTIVLDDGNFFVALLDESTLAISETGNAKEALVFDRVGPQMRTVLLPEDSHVLDLATGRLYEIPHEEYEETEEILAYFRRLGKGDLAYDDKVLCTVRGAKIQLMEGGRASLLEARRYASDCACYLLPYKPCRLLVTTAEGDSYEVQALAATGDGINLEYRKLLHRPVPMAPVETGKRKVFLPECDTTTYDLLDLASGRIINSEPGGEMLDVKDPDGKGNIYFDRNSKGDWLASLRGTRMQLRTDGNLSSPEPELLSRGIAAYYALREIPCQYLVTTAQGDKYELKVLSIETGDKPGVYLEYWKSAALPVAPVKITAVLRPAQPDLAKAAHQQERVNSARKLSGLGKAVAMYAADNNGKLPDTLQELKPYVGDDFQWLLENVKYLGKGQKSGEPDTPIAYDKTLLEMDNGTNMLFLDGHMEFLKTERLVKLIIGIAMGGETEVRREK
jgi:prepilin-type processing-associated H-X9-DG protein